MRPEVGRTGTGRVRENGEQLLTGEGQACLGRGCWLQQRDEFGFQSSTQGSTLTDGRWDLGTEVSVARV